MRGFAKTVVAGHVGKDPELSTFGPESEPVQVARFSIAVNHYRKDRDDVVTWYDCRVFGKRAAVIGEHVRKGDPLLVEGRIETREWDGENGERRTGWSLIVQDFEFLGAAPDRGQAPPAQPSGRPDFGDDQPF